MTKSKFIFLKILIYEIWNSHDTKSSYKIDLLRMTSHLKLIIRKFSI